VASGIFAALQRPAAWRISIAHLRFAGIWMGRRHRALAPPYGGGTHLASTGRRYVLTLWRTHRYVAAAMCRRIGVFLVVRGAYLGFVAAIIATSTRGVGAFGAALERAILFRKIACSSLSSR